LDIWYDFQKKLDKIKLSMQTFKISAKYITGY